ncbi:hypothetical protein [Burkholderia territorii]|uniref:hypothetical protein n=1 Tax=Burkholderia territorii TaxID=1503055 RepID=UPI0012D8F6FC|nr:hypothetical protein [Burkholderia territorii]
MKTGNARVRCHEHRAHRGAMTGRLLLRTIRIPGCAARRHRRAAGAIVGGQSVATRR